MKGFSGVDQIFEYLDYDEATGVVRWKKSRRKVRAGSVAGTVARCRTNNYIQIGFNYKLYRAHVLAWAIKKKSWPHGEIDHVDGDGLNNRWKNLRVVDRSTNAMNRKLSSNNTSGINGVTWHKRAKKWNARIYINGKEVGLGLYADILDAKNARLEAERDLAYTKTHGRRDAKVQRH